MSPSLFSLLCSISGCRRSFCFCCCRIYMNNSASKTTNIEISPSVLVLFSFDLSLWLLCAIHMPTRKWLYDDTPMKNGQPAVSNRHPPGAITACWAKTTNMSVWLMACLFISHQQFSTLTKQDPHLHVTELRFAEKLSSQIGSRQKNKNTRF